MDREKFKKIISFYTTAIGLYFVIVQFNNSGTNVLMIIGVVLLILVFALARAKSEAVQKLLAIIALILFMLGVTSGVVLMFTYTYMGLILVITLSPALIFTILYLISLPKRENNAFHKGNNTWPSTIDKFIQKESDVEQRLHHLESLYQQGLISRDEYDDKRADILRKI